MKLARVLILSCALAHGGAAFGQQPTLPDQEAKRLFEEINNTKSYVNISYGPVTIIGGPAGGNQTHRCGSGTMNESELRYAQAAAQAGLMSIAEDASSQSFRQGKSFSWDQMLAATTAGVQNKIVISPTPLGSSLDITNRLPPADRLPNCLRFMDGKHKVDQVLRNEVQKKGLATYAIVYLTYVADWNPYYLAIERSLDSPARNKERKAIAVFKYDDFKRSWAYKAGDFSNRESDFSSKNVEAYLANAPSN
jgi:hypothetical protein